MKLLESAYDGDIGSVRGVLSTGVPVDVTYPVSYCKRGTEQSSLACQYTKCLDRMAEEVGTKCNVTCTC